MRFAKVLKNVKIEGKHEFNNIKIKGIKNNIKTKEIKVAGEYFIITFNKYKEIKLVKAWHLKGNCFI